MSKLRTQKMPRAQRFAKSWRISQRYSLNVGLSTTAMFLPLLVLLAAVWCLLPWVDWFLHGITWFACALCIVLCISPIGNQVLGEETALPLWQWGRLSLGIQAIALLFLPASYTAFVSHGPPLLLDQLPEVDLQPLSLGISFGVWALTTVAMAVHVHARHTAPVFSDMILPTHVRPWQRWFRQYISMVIMQIHIFLWIATMFASVLLLVTFVQNYYDLGHPYWYPALFGSGFLFISWKRRAMTAWLRSQQRRGRHFMALFALLWTMLFGLWVILSYCNGAILAQVGVPVLHSAHQYIAYLNAFASPMERWKALCFSALLLQTWWVSSYMAAFAQGRTIRCVVLTCFIWPVIGWGLTSYAPQCLDMAQHLAQTYRDIVYIIAGLGLLGISAAFVRNHHTLRIFAQVGLVDKVPRKFYGVSKLTKYFLHYVFFLGAIFSILGWYFLQLLVVLGAIVTVLLVVGLCWGLCRK